MPEKRTPTRSAGRRLRLWIGLVTGLLGLAALCLRYEIFAAASDPPSPEWRAAGQVFAERVPLENVPVVVSTRATADGMTVTVANRGATTLTYSAYAGRGVQLLQEFEEHGRWTPANWDWCGIDKETRELAPGDEVPLAVSFGDPRRERMLGGFAEKGTARCRLIVLASERGCVTVNPGALITLAGASLTAICVWLTVRIVNRRERWAKWTLAVATGLPILYVLSFGPACWLSDRYLLPREAVDCAYRPLVSLGIDAGFHRPLRWYGTLIDMPPMPAVPPESQAMDCRAHMAVEIEMNAASDHFDRSHGRMPFPSRP